MVCADSHGRHCRWSFARPLVAVCVGWIGVTGWARKQNSLVGAPPRLGEVVELSGDMRHDKLSHRCQSQSQWTFAFTLHFGSAEAVALTHRMTE